MLILYQNFEIEYRIFISVFSKNNKCNSNYNTIVRQGKHLKFKQIIKLVVKIQVYFGNVLALPIHV